MKWYAELAIILAFSCLVFGVVLIVEVRKRLKESPVPEVKTRLQLNEVQIHPTNGTTDWHKPESKGLRWFRCITYPLATPFILVMFVVMLLWVFFHKPETVDAEAEKAMVKQELEEFVATSRARMSEARKARVFEQVLQRDVAASRDEAKALRTWWWSYLFDNKARKEARMFHNAAYHANRRIDSTMQ